MANGYLRIYCARYVTGLKDIKKLEQLQPRYSLLDTPDGIAIGRALNNFRWSACLVSRHSEGSYIATLPSLEQITEWSTDIDKAVQTEKDWKLIPVEKLSSYREIVALEEDKDALEARIGQGNLIRSRKA